MLGFETVTLVPYETHLIDYSLLTDEEVRFFSIFFLNSATDFDTDTNKSLRDKTKEKSAEVIFRYM